MKQTLGEKQRWMSLPMFVIVCVLVIAALLCLGNCTSDDQWRKISNVVKDHNP